MVLVTKMICIGKDSRPKAEKVYTDFDAVYQQAKLDLKTNPNFYMNGVAERERLYEISGFDGSSVASHLTGVEEKSDAAAQQGSFLENAQWANVDGETQLPVISGQRPRSNSLITTASTAIQTSFPRKKGGARR